MRFTLTLLIGLAGFASSIRADEKTDPPIPASLSINPAEFAIQGADNVQRLLISGKASKGAGAVAFDYSRHATYESSNAAIAVVTKDGVVIPKGNGTVQIRASFRPANRDREGDGDRFQREQAPVSFRNQVVPILTRHGCNSGGCHGKQLGTEQLQAVAAGLRHRFRFQRPGQGSSRPTSDARRAGQQPAFAQGDRRGSPRRRPAHEARQFRIRTAAPLGPARHAQRIRQGSAGHAHRMLRRRPASSACMPSNSCWSPRSIRMAPSRDVTHEAQFKSNEINLVSVDDAGLMQTVGSTGDTSVMARYMGQVDVCNLSIPLAAVPANAPVVVIPKKNYIDERVQAKWQELKLTPSPLADDATFLRRAYLDAIGTLPTPAEVREFLADKSPNKREQVIDHLLSRNEYADFWAVKWGDLLRNQRHGQKEQQRGTFAFHAWIRNAFASNMPYDKFVRNIIAAQGTVDQHPPVIWYRTVRNLTHQTNDTAQLFLGTRINCAQCHHHPYEKWSQDDYYQLQAFFARMGRKAGEIAQEPAIFVKLDGQVRNPVTNKLMQPRGLDGPALDISEDDDPRHKLVDWMAAPENPFFARALANRMWAHFMSRGLVEPVDDLRVTNPPTNPELLDALAQDFIKHKFDVKHLIRSIMTSSTYQLSSEPHVGNLHDKQSYARAYPRRLLAEVMLDAISNVTGVQENFGGLPKGTRAIQLPDESVGSYFLDTFGRPTRETPCECERPREANLAQALHLLNSGEVQNKIASGNGRIALLFKAKKSDAEIVEELYLLALGRLPRPEEQRSVLAYVAAESDRKAALEDVLWAILNTKEFLFNH